MSVLQTYRGFWYDQTVKDFLYRGVLLEDFGLTIAPIQKSIIEYFQFQLPNFPLPKSVEKDFSLEKWISSTKI